MLLPDLIEIVPPTIPVVAKVAVPGSKSLTNRALILSALASGETTLRGALWSEDTQVMTESLQRLGICIETKLEGGESSNRTIVVRGASGIIPNAGTLARPLELFVGNSGTAARFLAALVCLGKGVYRLQGTARMRERPQTGLCSALRRLGYRVDSGNDRLPLDIFGSGPKPGASCTVSLAESSQFASALLLCADAGGWKVAVEGENEEEAPYVAMTQRLIENFPAKGGEYQIEPDASSASYFCAAQWLLGSGSSIQVADYPKSRWQIDAAFPEFLPLPWNISRRSQLGDSIMTAMILAPFAAAPVEFSHLERLRVQECERVAAMRIELTKCGATVIEKGESLIVFPNREKLRGAEIETYDDHRIAMCFATLGLRIAGMKIKNPACVKKTFPDFFQKLASPPPEGLGATIFGSTDRTALPLAGLFAN